MEGNEIRRDLPMLLAVGLGCCLEKMAGGGGGGGMRESLTTILDDLEMPEEDRNRMFGPILAHFDEAAKHELSFEITEYLEPESMMALSSALAVMFDAFFSGSTITIE